MNRLRFVFFLVALLVPGGAALAQGWPARPLHWIVPYPPGGSTDIAARPLADRVAQALGQPAVVENRAGAGGNIGIEAASRAAPDGYTVLIAPDAIASNPHLYKMSWDPFRDFVPVIQVSRQPVVLAAHPSLGVSSLAELVALARRKPGLAFATSGAGSQQHMAAEWFAKLAGIKLTHVPYKGGGQAITDLVGGQVPLGSLGSSPLIPYYKAGKLKLLAQSTAKRAPSLPEVPTYGEAGYKELVIEQWLGAFVPAGTPAEIVARLNAEIGRALAEPQIRERYAQAALEPVGGSAEDMAKLLRADYDKYGRLIKELNIRLE
ncbi:MAG TPA: tripartite tricarboxylate transporter substrate binding protein [Burkholderiales bacterium]|nr:tripartite tricarboxylate transporter substrate binding protein [Burkholderiales bacterium]